MLNAGIHSFFIERSKKTWKDAGFACLAGVAVSDVTGSATAAAMTAAAMFLPSAFEALDAHRERNGDKAPVGSETKSDNDRRALEASPFYRAIDVLKHKLSFEDFVTELANGSNHYGRRLSVTCIRIAGLTEVERSEVASLLRQTVRASDEVRQMSDEEFLVCTPLLASAKDADQIVNRLRRALLNSDLLEGRDTPSLGRALHPRDGYSGADLIQAARDNLQASEREVSLGNRPKLCAV